jgi:hypothetical protein
MCTPHTRNAAAGMVFDKEWVHWGDANCTDDYVAQLYIAFASGSAMELMRNAPHLYPNLQHAVPTGNPGGGTSSIGCQVSEDSWNPWDWSELKWSAPPPTPLSTLPTHQCLRACVVHGERRVLQVSHLVYAA